MGEYIACSIKFGGPAIPVAEILKVENMIDGFAQIIKRCRAFSVPLRPFEIVA